MAIRPRVVLVGIAGACALAACSVPTSLTRQMEARRLAADLHVQFTKAADAGNRSVMADTDEAARAAASEAEQATQRVLRDVEQLKPLLAALGFRDERRVLDTFTARFEEFRQLDAEILPLAVENSNLKAQRLSFGPAREAAASFRVAVDAAARTAPPQTAPRADALAARAILSVLDILVLQAPHIAEAEDAAMTKIETEMTASAAAGRRALAALKSQLPPTGAAPLAAAATAFDRFTAINAELLTLSRRNSDVRSVALSLGRKRVITAVCDDQLRALEEALARHDNRATR